MIQRRKGGEEAQHFEDSEGHGILGRQGDLFAILSSRPTVCIAARQLREKGQKDYMIE